MSPREGARLVQDVAVAVAGVLQLPLADRTFESREIEPPPSSAVRAFRARLASYRERADDDLRMRRTAQPRVATTVRIDRIA
jgi:hypothetical protein